MHVPSYQVDRRRRPARGAVAAALLLWFASIAGVAQAVEFDEKLKAPMIRGGAELKSMAESYSAGFARLSTASPAEMVTNKALFLEHFDLEWQIKRALEDKRPMEDLSAVGLVKDESGAFRIDFNAFPQWQPFPETLASMMPVLSLDTAGLLLINRGFRESDVEAIRNYVETHDLNTATSARALPIAISFSKLVKKYDKLKLPINRELVFSYLYQRNKADAEVRREWSEGLIQVLDDQRVRVLHSYFAEMKSTGVWSASDTEAGVAGLLALMRLPDFEQRALAESRGAEARGATP
jgi:hypothetical protein